MPTCNRVELQRIIGIARITQLSAAKLRQSVGEQSKLLEAQHKDLVLQKAVFAAYERNLASTRVEFKTNQEQIGLLRQTYEFAYRQLEQRKTELVSYLRGGKKKGGRGRRRHCLLFRKQTVVHQVATGLATLPRSLKVSKNP